MLALWLLLLLLAHAAMRNEVHISVLVICCPYMKAESYTPALTLSKEHKLTDIGVPASSLGPNTIPSNASITAMLQTLLLLPKSTQHCS